MCYNCTFNILSYTFFKVNNPCKNNDAWAHSLYIQKPVVFTYLFFLQSVNLMQRKHYIH